MSFNKEKPRVAIVGSGVGGIAMAIGLKKQLNFDNFVIFEKESDIGGTWRDNTYPGCSSDVAGHWYCLSYEPNPSWSSLFVLQPEILAYWQGLVSKYGLRKHIVVNTAVVHAVWDDAAQYYRLTLRDTKTGEEHEEVAEAVVSAAGGFSEPRYPDIPGIEDFKGPKFHSARWRKDVGLSGKTIGVVGNAASGVQLVPRISEDPSVRVINFCRTPNWFAFRPNYKYPTWAKLAFAYIPGVMWAYRTLLFTRYDIVYLIFQNSHKRIQVLARKMLTKEIKARAPKEHADKLVPSYPPGCRRIIIDPGYFKCLHQPNVSLEWDGISKFVPEGLVTKTGRTIPLDVVVFATGFFVCKLMTDIVGQGGQSLQEYFNSKGGPTAYLGTTVPGFPNFFSILGPNIATGHASVIFSEEAQVNYAIQLLAPILSRSASSFSVKSSVTDAYNNEIQKHLTSSVWAACTSYYRAGTDGAGKNVAIWPGPVTAYWWRTRRVDWNDYEAFGADKWEAERKKKKKVRALILVMVLALLAAGTQSGVRSAVLGVLAPFLAKVSGLVYSP